jgi:hypothetical protein
VARKASVVKKNGSYIVYGEDGYILIVTVSRTAVKQIIQEYEGSLNVSL